MSPEALTDLTRAAIELGLARARLKSFDLRSLVASEGNSEVPYGHRQNLLIDRVAYAIPRVAARVPWRADCLVQAIAAKRWLGKHGVEATIKIGVPLEKPAEFEAHAWLTAGGRVVTGGDIRGFNPLARP